MTETASAPATKPTQRRGSPQSLTVAVFRRSLVPMVIANDQRRYVAANSAACLLLRLPEEAVLARSIEDLTPPENRAQVRPMWEAFLRDGTQRGVFELLMPDGPRLVVEYSATANIAPGRHLSILMFPAGRSTRPSPTPVRKPALLSKREREVLAMIAMGVSGSGIASQLDISRLTVETHVRHCLAKLGARNRAHAIALGVRTGEITLDVSTPT